MFMLLLGRTRQGSVASRILLLRGYDSNLKRGVDAASGAVRLSFCSHPPQDTNVTTSPAAALTPAPRLFFHSFNRHSLFMLPSRVRGAWPEFPILPRPQTTLRH